MKRFSIALAVALLVTLVSMVGAVADHQLDITTTKAPITPDGTTAGAITDFVLTFRDIDPAVFGISMLAGGTVTATLPPAFVNTEVGTNTAILLQGWPQSPPAPPPAFPWVTTTGANTVTATLTSDFLVGDSGPGFKQVHLLLNSFRNPGPGMYDVDLVIQPDPTSTVTYSGIGTVHILPKARPSVNAVSVFSGGAPPPFNNAIYQSVLAGDAANPVGLYLWDGGSSVLDGVFAPFLDVDIAMTSLTHGRLVQGKKTVGQVWIDAPAGADDYGIATGGPSSPGITAISGFPVGVLLTTFTTDADVTGPYTITYRLNNGNTQRLFVTAQ